MLQERREILGGRVLEVDERAKTLIVGGEVAKNKAHAHNNVLCTQTHKHTQQTTTMQQVVQREGKRVSLLCYLYHRDGTRHEGKTTKKLNSPRIHHCIEGTQGIRRR